MIVDETFVLLLIVVSSSSLFNPFIFGLNVHTIVWNVGTHSLF